MMKDLYQERELSYFINCQAIFSKAHLLTILTTQKAQA